MDIECLYCRKVKKKYPDKIICINNNSDSILDKYFPEQKNSINFFKYFTRNESCEFYTPDQNWKNLLLKNEVYYISNLANYYFPQYIKVTNKIDSNNYFILIDGFLVKVLFFMSHKYPMNGKKTLDFCFFPIKTIKRNIYNFLYKFYDYFRIYF